MKEKKIISLHSPNISGEEYNYIEESLSSKMLTLGKYCEIFEKKISDFTSSKYSIACVNGTSALQISLKIAGVEKNDEVIVPTLTFIAPINAIKYNNASPIFMDVDDFHLLDINKTIKFIKNETIFKSGYTFNKKTSKKISAIIPVHTWGNAVNLEELYLICSERNITIIEDASESLGTTYLNGKFSNKHTGTIGLIGCLSFNANKIITSGGGGMILTDNENIAKKARYYINQAKDDSIWYIHNEIGYNFRLSNVHSSIGVAQLEKINDFLAKKKNIHKYYNDNFDKFKGLSIMNAPNHSNSNYWLNILNINEEYSKNLKQVVIDLNKKNILVRPVWYLNHLQKPYANCQTYELENAQKIVANSLCLPSGTDLTEDDLNCIIKYFYE